MAKEIQIAYTDTALTLYAVVRNSVGQVWNTSGTPAFETYQTANLGNYAIALTEAGTASRYYTANMPAIVLGVYTIAIYVRAGGSPAEGDVLAGTKTIDWNGTEVINLTDIPESVWLAGTTTYGTTSDTMGYIQQFITIMYQIISTLLLSKAGVVQDASATTTSFKTNLTEVDNFWNDATLVITQGALTSQARIITSYVQVNGVVNFDEPFTSAPGDTIQFSIRTGHNHTITQILSELNLLDVNLASVNNNVGGAAGFDRAIRGIGTLTVDSGATTTSIPTSSLSPSAAVTDQFKSRILIFDNNTTTVNLRGQATDITGSSSGGTLTVTALTDSPVFGDTATIQ